MPGYDNTNSGALFKNDRKTNDNQPGYTGNMEVKCEHCKENTIFWLSAWVKKSKAGQSFFSLALTPKEETQSSGDNSSTEDFDDDVPF